MRPVNSAKSENRQQHHYRDEQQTINNPSIAQPVVIKLHGREHHHETNRRPDGLLDHVIILRAVFALGDHRRSAINHDYTKQSQPHGRREEPFIWIEFLCHLISSFRFQVSSFRCDQPETCDLRLETSSLKTRPRCSKLSNMSKLAHAGASKTMSPGSAD